ncbi:MAG: acyltransferase family protein [Pseudomonadales bacterium]
MILSIQYMRAIAALLVVFHHVAKKGEQYSTDPLSWYTVGGAGVDLFFIISGYVMCQTTFNRKTNIADFLQARIIRIVPLYWVLTSAALLIFLIMPERVNSSGGVTSIFHSYSLLPTSSKYLIHNGWTLSYEFYFYLIFAFGLLLSGVLKHLIPSLVLMSLVLFGFYYDSEGVYFSFLTNSLLLEFICGIALFNCYRRIRFNIHLSFSLLPVSLILLTWVSISSGFSVRILDYGVPCLLFFIALLNLEPTFQKFKANSLSRSAEFLGNASYSLYLIHPFMLVICAIMVAKLGLTNHAFFFLFTLLSGSVLGGCCCYLFLEKPILNIAKKYISIGSKTNNRIPAIQ